ncbi:hypothetical protein [uncultured Erythrobacter sp.]|uniref:hypothetical protein n=1 Tax=uncultured Erythrobacter sp. TaxID=263913 RepID=UPI0026155DF4|nr:hypothetical protein [uncultured Erythrobacter sp.]
MRLQPFEVGQERYPLEQGNVHAQNPVKRNTQKRLAAIIGYVALGMPVVLALGGLILSVFELGDFTESLSAFYYQEFLLGDIFVGCLIFLGIAMFAYQGWHSKIATLASFCGVCMFLVALFPADGWIMLNEVEQDEFNGRVIFELVSDQVHLWASVIVFLILAWFCFFVFTRVTPDQVGPDGELIPTKKSRNRFYRISGTIILLSLGATGLAFLLDEQVVRQYRLIYVGETICLLTYGVSWMVQGRVFSTLADPKDVQDAKG